LKRFYFVALSISVLFVSAHPAEAMPQKRIPAKAAVIMDSSGAVLYSKYPDARLAPASTVKLITAMVVIDRLKPETKVVISKNAGKVRSIQPRLHADEEYTVSDLLHLALMKSINSSAVALAEATAGSEKDFVTLMNQKAKEIGVRNTLFANASGLPKGVQYTTAADLALIMRAALSYPLIKEILGKKGCLITTSQGRELYLETSNDLLWRSDTMIGGKTGYTGNARHCFVCSVNTEKGPLFFAILGARSRGSLWKSTLLLTEIGTDPNVAESKGKTRLARSSTHPVVK